MNIELTAKEFRRLLDLVYIGNWVLNSTRGDDRFADYDDLESKIFALSPALSEIWNGTIVPSRAYTEGGIHEAIAYYEDNVFYEILAEELSRRDMEGFAWFLSAALPEKPVLEAACEQARQRRSPEAQALLLEQLHRRFPAGRSKRFAL